MNIYKIETGLEGYDTFENGIISARSKREAKNLWRKETFNTPVKTIVRIGVSIRKRSQVECTSFRAG